MSDTYALIVSMKTQTELKHIIIYNDVIIAEKIIILLLLLKHTFNAWHYNRLQLKALHCTNAY